YASIQGRFTSADTYGGRLTNPQTLNRYAYSINSPLKYTDPTGHFNEEPQQPICDERCQQSRKEAERLRKEAEANGEEVITTTTNSCVALLCGHGMRRTPATEFFIATIYGMGTPLGMVEQG